MLFFIKLFIFFNVAFSWTVRSKSNMDSSAGDVTHIYIYISDDFVDSFLVRSFFSDQSDGNLVQKKIVFDHNISTQVIKFLKDFYESDLNGFYLIKLTKKSSIIVENENYSKLFLQKEGECSVQSQSVDTVDSCYRSKINKYENGFLYYKSLLFFKKLQLYFIPELESFLYERTSKIRWFFTS